jgi:hypothetical protein
MEYSVLSLVEDVNHNQFLHRRQRQPGQPQHQLLQPLQQKQHWPRSSKTQETMLVLKHSYKHSEHKQPQVIGDLNYD